MNLQPLAHVGATYTASASSDAALALSQGKHVFCDPPLAPTNEECDRLLDVASRHGRILMVRHALRFRPEYRYLSTFKAEHGPIQSATFICHAGMPADAPGTSLLYLLLDEIDQALLLFGLPAQVNCKAFAGPETAMATLIYPGGPEVRIQGGWFAAALPMTESYQVRTQSAELSYTREGLAMNDQYGQRQSITTPVCDAQAEMLAYFVECCSANKQPSLCPPASSALAVRVALLLKQSREIGGQPLECKV